MFWHINFCTRYLLHHRTKNSVEKQSEAFLSSTKLEIYAGHPDTEILGLAETVSVSRKYKYSTIFWIFISMVWHIPIVD